MEKLVFYRDEKKLYQLFFGSLIALVTSYFIFSAPMLPGYHRGAAIMMALLPLTMIISILLILCSAYLFIVKKPLLIISSDGIYYYPLFTGSRFIPWQELQGVEIYVRKPNPNADRVFSGFFVPKYLRLLISDEYARQSSIQTQEMIKGIFIPLEALKTPGEEILQLINQYKNKNIT